jgi:hypothetical protein
MAGGGQPSHVLASRTFNSSQLSRGLAQLQLFLGQRGTGMDVGAAEDHGGGAGFLNMGLGAWQRTFRNVPIGSGRRFAPKRGLNTPVDTRIKLTVLPCAHTAAAAPPPMGRLGVLHFLPLLVASSARITFAQPGTITACAKYSSLRARVPER